MPPRWHHVVVAASEWTNNEHVDRYLAHADTFPHRAEGQSVLLDHVPLTARRILDLGTGDGRLLALLRVERPGSVGVALDVSERMLARARERFAGEPVEVLRNDLAEPLPEPGGFDAVVSCYAIHHLEDDRKRSLYAEVFAHLEPGGVYPPDWEDPPNRLVDVETQLRWLRKVGFDDVDCYWKWLEMALLIGVKLNGRTRPSRCQPSACATSSTTSTTRFASTATCSGSPWRCGAYVRHAHAGRTPPASERPRRGGRRRAGDARRPSGRARRLEPDRRRGSRSRRRGRALASRWRGLWQRDRERVSPGGPLAPSGRWPSSSRHPKRTPPRFRRSATRELRLDGSRSSHQR